MKNTIVLGAALSYLSCKKTYKYKWVAENGKNLKKHVLESVEGQQIEWQGRISNKMLTFCVT
jgi:hypothetical protein